MYCGRQGLGQLLDLELYFPASPSKARVPVYTMATNASQQAVSAPVRTSLLRRSEYPDPFPLILPRGLGRGPQGLICPYCCQSVQTTLQFRSGAATWLCAAGICFAGGVAGCCLIPFFSSALKDCEHYCPTCQRFLGRRAYINL